VGPQGPAGGLGDAPVDGSAYGRVDAAWHQVVPLIGATMTGALTLWADPTQPLQAATKRTVDAKVALTGDTMTGALTLPGDPTQPLQAATKQMVDARVLRSGDTMSGALTLPGDPTLPLQAATKQMVDGKVTKTGDTMTGALILPGDPTSPLQAATKAYVDAHAPGNLPEAPIDSYSYGRLNSSWQRVLPLSGGNLTGALTLQADPTQPLQAATKQYTDTRVLKAGDTMTGTLVLSGDPTQPLQAATKAYVDAHAPGNLPEAPVDGYLYGRLNTSWQRGLPVAGGTMTGALLLSANPTQPLEAATKQTVDAKIAKAGDAMTGPLTLAADPAQPLQAATKQYADLRVVKAGDTMTGALTLAADPTQPLQAATKQYVDGHSGGIIDAPSDSFAYGRVNAAWQKVMPLAGGTMTGPIVLANDPTQPMQAATKQYSDMRVLKAGDTMTGQLLLQGNPTANLEAAPKQYVDARAGVIVSPTAPPSALDGSLWWENDSGNLWLRYNDGNSAQWVSALNVPTYDPTQFVPISGGTMTGSLVVQSGGGTGCATAITYGGGQGNIVGTKNGLLRWNVVVNDSATESGSNSGSNFGIARYNDDGTWLDTPIQINRAVVPNSQITLATRVSIKPSAWHPELWLDKPGSGYSNNFSGKTNGSERWIMVFGDGSAESGANAGSNFLIAPRNDTGGGLPTALTITRATSIATFGSEVVINGGWVHNGAVPGGNVHYEWLNSSGTRIGLMYVQTADNTMQLQNASNTMWRSDGVLIFSGQAYKPGGGPWADSSDERIKNVIGEYTHGLDEVLALRPVKYTFKGNDTTDPPSNAIYDEPVPKDTPVVPYKNSGHYQAAKDGKEFIGLVAQEVEPLLPHMVTKHKGFIDGEPVTDIRDLDTTSLIFTLINAVKQLNARIATLERRR
jgi:hypothetical protein